MTGSVLAKEFKRLKVRKKPILARKIHPGWPFTKQAAFYSAVNKEVDTAIADGRRLVFVDEAVISRKTKQRKAFSQTNENIVVKQS